jgi:hypothetical protein
MPRENVTVMRNRRVRLILMAVVAAVVAFSLVVSVYSWYLRTTAQQLRDDLVLLTGTSGSHSDVLRLAEKYARFRVPAVFFVRTSEGLKYSFGPTDSCTNHSCVLEFEVPNNLLSRIHLAKPSLFGATVVEVDNRISYVEMMLDGAEQARGVGARTTYMLPNTVISEGFPDFSSRPPYSFAGPFGKFHMRTILSDSASPEQKRKATAFNLGCLTSVRGCNWPCDYLPLAWRDYRDALPEDVVEGFKRSGSKCAW